MRKLRNLTVLFLFVLAAMGFNPVAIQASPEAPGPDCTWSYGAGGYNGTWSCSWGCDYYYFHERGAWVHTGTDCLPMYD
jgi:hypothetical protein